MTFKCWMILRDPPILNGKLELSQCPRFVHETRESAEKEAERLALLHGESFLVLESVAAVHPKANGGLSRLPAVIPQYENLESAR